MGDYSVCVCLSVCGVWGVCVVGVGVSVYVCGGVGE